MSTKGCLLFVNLRRIPKEGYESLVAAKRLGYDVVLLTNRDMPDFIKRQALHIEHVDTYDREASIAAAKQLATRFDIKGVPNWAEVDVVLVAHIAQELGLPGISPEAALRCRNKFLMKQALVEVPDVLPAFARVQTWEDAQQAIETIGYPAILKPTGSSGSKGIFEVNSLEDLQRAFAALQDIAHPNFDPVFKQFGSELILEEFISGPEYSVEGIVFENQTSIITTFDKWTTVPYCLEYRLISPAPFTEEQLRLVHEKTFAIVEAIGLNNCAFHLEFKLSPKGFRFVEIGARPAGGCMASHLVPVGTGIDFYQQLIRVSVGEEPQLEPTAQLYTGLRFILAEQEGIFEGLSGFETLFARPEIIGINMESSVGAKVVMPPKHFSAQLLVSVLAKGHTYEEISQTLEEAATTLTPRISPATAAVGGSE